MFTTPAGQIDPYTGEPQIEGFVIAGCDHEPTVDAAMYEHGMRWIKATNEQVVFVNIEGQATALARTDGLPPDRLQINLNSLYDATVDADAGRRPVNRKICNFFKFRGTRTVIWSDLNGLYVKFAGGEFHQIISTRS